MNLKAAYKSRFFIAFVLQKCIIALNGNKNVRVMILYNIVRSTENGKKTS
jgi:hypothetical protein